MSETFARDVQARFEEWYCVVGVVVLLCCVVLCGERQRETHSISSGLLYNRLVIYFCSIWFVSPLLHPFSPFLSSI